MKYLVISDLHFKHNRLPSSLLAKNLVDLFIKNEDLLKDLDVLFIAGDLTHTTVGLRDPETNIMLGWLSWVLKFCKENDIVFRLLEGTASHDVGQGKIVYALPESRDIDFKYIDTVCVETITGKTVLFVPDDWASTRDELDRDIAAALKEANVHQVDIAILHGLFDYQLPNSQQHVAFNEEYMLSIVRGFISIGHVHVYNPQGRIIPQGSFDRMSFNEEEDKGGCYFDTEVEGYTRLINEGALIFKDVDVGDKVTVSSIRDDIETLPTGSWVRLVGPKDNPLIASLPSVKEEFEDYNITIKKTGADKAEVTNRELDLTAAVVLNKDTLLDAFTERLDGMSEYSESTVKIARGILESIMLGDEK